MNIHENEHRYNTYRLWEKKKHQPYDYVNEGLVNKIVSNRIANTSNPVLRMMLNIYENMCVFVLRYIDILQHFHNYTKYNR